MLRLMGRVLAAGLILYAGASHAQVVVSQLHGGGGNTGATYRSDFIELHNNGATAVDLSTWSVQYASSTGTTWARTNLSGSIPAGAYYLVKQADGASTTALPLPTPDATGTIAMSGTAGKVALVNSQTSLTGACPLGGTVVDFVGFGTANCSETAPTPAPSNTLAVLRAGNGCTDSNNNGADFATGAAAPRNSATALNVCGGSSTPLLAVSDVSIFEGDAGTTTMSFGFGLSAPAGVGGVSINYTTADGTAIAGSDYTANSGTVTIAEGATSTTVDILVTGDTVSEANETFFVRVTAATGATIADNEGLGTIQNDDVTVVSIAQIQGSGLTSPVNGAIVTTEGIVTAQKFNNGFFLQTSDAEIDADPNTSEGIFIFTSTAPPATAAVGNRVRVTGTVTEFTPSTNLNQLSITELGFVTAIQVLSSGNTLPAPIALTSADFDDTSTPGTAEKFEGMRVSATNALATTGAEGNITESSATATTTGVFHIVLSGVARPFREEGIDILDLFPIPAGKDPPRFDHNAERIMVRSRGQIGATAVAIDAETQIDSMVGVMDYFSGAWAVLPDPTGGLVVSGGKIPAAVSTAGNADVTIGAFNLLRFFDEVNNSNGAPTLTAAALDKRLTKTSLAICDYLKTPDILGVVEVENLRVLGLLADRINATCATAPGYVPYLVQGNDVGGINVGFLVSNRSVGSVARVEVLEVTQFGKDTLLSNPDGSTSLLNDRPPLMLRAIVHHQNGGTYPVTAFINHLRSLNGVGDATPGSNGWPTENARVSAKRAQQAVFLADLVEARQTADANEHIVLLGDFNAFEYNDGYVDVMGIIGGNPTPEPQVLTYSASPITIPLINGNLLTPDKDERYSYVFDGNLQTLDHVVVNEAAFLDAADIEVDHARINSEFGEHHFGIAGTALRVSDHDPVRVRITVPGFTSANLSITAGASPANVAAGGIATFTASVNNAGTDEAAFPSVALVFDALVPVTVTAPAGWTCAAPVQAGGTTTVTCTAASLANGGSATFSAAVTAPSLPVASTLSLAAAVTSQTNDPANADNSASAQVAVAAVVVVLPNADLSLRMVGGPSGFIRSGRTALFSVPVRNTGPNAVPQAVVTFTGTIPLANASVIAPAGWTCPRNTTAGGFSIVCTLTGSFAVNGRHTFTFSGVAPSHLVQSSMSMTSSVSSTTTTDQLPGNNTSVYSVNIVAP
ncbi:MAG: nuclease [Lysobacter sp.]|nr:nuclease [Lysobacter sp.]